MARVMLPDNRFRSPTALEGKADLRDENIYSAMLLGASATGQAKIFTNPQGQSIPKLGTYTAVNHQVTYSEVTTNLTKAGELGSSIGDVSVRAVSINLEPARADEAVASAGATPYETVGFGGRDSIEAIQKLYFQFKVGGKKQLEGPIWHFPSQGGAVGSIAVAGTFTAEDGIFVQQVTNGNPAAGGRRLKIPILIARNDTLEGVVGVSGTYTGTTDHGGLVHVTLSAIVRGDVR
jgi:hypothetical protein